MAKKGITKAVREIGCGLERQRIELSSDSTGLNGLKLGLGGEKVADGEPE